MEENSPNSSYNTRRVRPNYRDIVMKKFKVPKPISKQKFSLTASTDYQNKVSPIHRNILIKKLKLQKSMLQTEDDNSLNSIRNSARRVERLNYRDIVMKKFKPVKTTPKNKEIVDTSISDIVLPGRKSWLISDEITENFDEHNEAVKQHQQQMIHRINERLAARTNRKNSVESTSTTTSGSEQSCPSPDECYTAESSMNSTCASPTMVMVDGSVGTDAVNQIFIRLACEAISASENYVSKNVECDNLDFLGFTNEEIDMLPSSIAVPVSNDELEQNHDHSKIHESPDIISLTNDYHIKKEALDDFNSDLCKSADVSKSDNKVHLETATVDTNPLKISKSDDTFIAPVNKHTSTNKTPIILNTPVVDMNCSSNFKRRVNDVEVQTDPHQTKHSTASLPFLLNGEEVGSAVFEGTATLFIDQNQMMQYVIKGIEVLCFSEKQRQSINLQIRHQILSYQLYNTVHHRDVIPIYVVVNPEPEQRNTLDYQVPFS